MLNVDKYYHFTKYEYLEHISEFGLVPQIGDRSFSVNDERKAVFLSKEKLSTILMFFAMKWFYESHKGTAGQELLDTAVSSIDYYNKLLERRQRTSNKISFLRKNIEELKKNREAAIRTKNQVENMNKYSSFEEYWGKGVYLSISNVSDVKYINADFHNCWVEEKINPEDINIVVLRHKETGEIIDNKDAIIDYFMATTTVNDLFTEYKRTTGINDDKYIAHSTMKEFDKYYLEHEKEFYILKNYYEIIEIPIKEYMNTNGKITKKSI